MSDAITPFRLDVLETELDRLRARLRDARWPERETVSDDSQGVRVGELRALCRYWTEPDRGGHFAAFEQPAVFVDEARAFFRLVRGE